jgi:hypothetical protein
LWLVQRKSADEFTLREALRLLPDLMRHGRWKSASVMRGYIEEGSIWNDNAAARLGL